MELAGGKGLLVGHRKKRTSLSFSLGRKERGRGVEAPVEEQNLLGRSVERHRCTRDSRKGF